MFFVVVRKWNCLPTSYQNVGVNSNIINPYLFTKFHTSKHLGRRVTQTCMFTLFFVVVQKGVVYQCWCRIGIPYLTTKFQACKHFGKRVTQTCMPYCNVWAEVVIVFYQKVCVYQNFNMPIPCASPKSISPPSFICGCTPVSEIRKFNQKKKKKKGIQKKNLTHFA